MLETIKKLYRTARTEFLIHHGMDRLTREHTQRVDDSIRKVYEARNILLLAPESHPNITRAIRHTDKAIEHLFRRRDRLHREAASGYRRKQNPLATK